jgi:peptide deformylase
MNEADLKYTPVLELVLIGDKRLLKKCVPVGGVDDNIRNLVAQMLVTMWEHKGVGLAANQVGDNRRIAVVDVGDGIPLVLINPKVIQRSKKKEFVEGCLSIPGQIGKVKRAALIILEATDDEGRRYRTICDGVKAQAVQHEIDHLNGKLFTGK